MHRFVLVAALSLLSTGCKTKCSEVLIDGVGLSVVELDTEKSWPIDRSYLGVCSTGRGATFRRNKLDVDPDGFGLGSVSPELEFTLVPTLRNRKADTVVGVIPRISVFVPLDRVVEGEKLSLNDGITAARTIFRKITDGRVYTFEDETGTRSGGELELYVHGFEGTLEIDEINQLDGCDDGSTFDLRIKGTFDWSFDDQGVTVQTDGKAWFDMTQFAGDEDMDLWCASRPVEPG